MNILLNRILVVSINYGSVAVVLQASTTDAPGSQGAIDQENNLNTLLSSSNGVGGMSVSSSSVTTNGGSNNNGGDSGLSRTTIIILAVCIPCGVLCTYFMI